jgi:hypothetical protein
MLFKSIVLALNISLNALKRNDLLIEEGLEVDLVENDFGVFFIVFFLAKILFEGILAKFLFLELVFIEDNFFNELLLLTLFLEETFLLLFEVFLLINYPQL